MSFGLNIWDGSHSSKIHKYDDVVVKNYLTEKNRTTRKNSFILFRHG